jgi:hypothetical protein
MRYEGIEVQGLQKPLDTTICTIGKPNGIHSELELTLAYEGLSPFLLNLLPGLIQEVRATQAISKSFTKYYYILVQLFSDIPRYAGDTSY